MGMISGWTEGILLSLAFVAVFGIAIGGFNSIYSKEYSLGLSDNSTEQLFVTYQNTSQAQLVGGEVAFDATQGITLKSSFDMAKDVVNIIWSFISGGWIEKTAEMMQLGASGLLVARAFRIIWFLSLIFAMLYALFKVVV